MTDTSITKQRLRITFTRDETLKYIGHLDMARSWQRIVRRANLPLAYSEGFNPQPRMSFAAALPVGCTSDHEELDMVLSPPGEIEAVKSQLDRAMPPGMRVVSIEEMPLKAPALQMQLAAAEFEIIVEGNAVIAMLTDRVRQFLAAKEVMRDRRGKVYNLRPLVQALSIEPAYAPPSAPPTLQRSVGEGVSAEPERAGRADQGAVIRARLQATPEGTGRPDELAMALGLDPATVRIKRTKLLFLDKTN